MQDWMRKKEEIQEGDCIRAQADENSPLQAGSDVIGYVTDIYLEDGTAIILTAIRVDLNGWLNIMQPLPGERERLSQLLKKKNPLERY